MKRTNLKKYPALKHFHSRKQGIKTLKKIFGTTVSKNAIIRVVTELYPIGK